MLRYCLGGNVVDVDGSCRIWSGCRVDTGRYVVEGMAEVVVDSCRLCCFFFAIVIVRYDE